MVKYIRIVVKPKIGSEQYVADIRTGYANEFIIPSKGDIIKLNDEQIGKWGGSETETEWEVLFIKYEYLKPIDGENVVVITIYVR